jgi:hypothetical protein
LKRAPLKLASDGFGQGKFSAEMNSEEKYEEV